MQTLRRSRTTARGRDVQLDHNRQADHPSIRTDDRALLGGRTSLIKMLCKRQVALFQIGATSYAALASCRPSSSSWPARRLMASMSFPEDASPAITVSSPKPKNHFRSSSSAQRMMRDCLGFNRFNSPARLSLRGAGIELQSTTVSKSCLH